MVVLAGAFFALCVVLALNLMQVEKQNARLEARANAELGFALKLENSYDALLGEKHELRERYEQREADFLRQIQSLSERIATLRMKGLNEGGEAQFTPMKDDKPYSDKLNRFLDGLVTDEARNLVVEKIEEQRAAGIDDEQIYDRIREGERL